MALPALPSVERDAVGTDAAKLFDPVTEKWFWATAASIAALAAAGSGKYKPLFVQDEDYAPTPSTIPATILGSETAVGSVSFAAADLTDGCRLLIKFQMRYALGDGDALTIIGKLKNLSDESEYAFFATTSTSQDFVFGQPSDNGFVEICIMLRTYGPTFTADASWVGGAEPSKQNGPKTSGGTIGATGPYEVELLAGFATAAGGSSVNVDNLSIDLIAGPS